MVLDKRILYIGIGVAIAVVVAAVLLYPVFTPKPQVIEEEKAVTITDIISSPDKFKNKWVSVNGTCDSIPYYINKSKEIRFSITDGNESIDVVIAGNVSSDAIYLKLVPFPGDYVEITGFVKVVSGTPLIYIYDTIDLKIERVEWRPEQVTSIDKSMEYSVVNVTGVVTDVSKGTYSITITLNVSGVEVLVKIPTIIELLGENISGYTNLFGYSVSISGVVYIIGTKPAIVVEHSGDIVVIGKAYFETINLASLSKHVGEEVTLSVVAGEIEYAGGYYVNIYDGTGIVKAFFSKDLFMEVFEPFTTGTGSNLTIKASVDSPTLVSVEEASVDKPYPSPLLSISDISEDIKGYTVAVKGTIRNLDIFTGEGGTVRFVIFYIEDDTGSIKIFMPGSTYEALEHQELIVEGEEVALAGYVDVYRGELEIVAYHSSSVQPIDYSVPGEGAGLPVLPKPTAGVVETDIAGLHQLSLGSAVKLSNIEVVNMTTLYKVYDKVAIGVRDGSGFTYIIVDLDLLSDIDPWSLGAGSTLNIVGTTDVERIWGVDWVIVDVEEFSVVGYSAPLEVSPVDVDWSMFASIITLTNVETVSPYSTSGHLIFNVSDGYGSVKVFIPSTVADKLDPSVKSAVSTEGVSVDVVGFVTKYRNSIEIWVYHPNGVRVSIGKPVSATISELEGLSPGTRVSLSVVFDTITYDRDKYKYFVKVHDDTGSTYLVFTRDQVVSTIDPWSVGSGSVFNVTGYVGFDEVYGVIVTIETVDVVEKVDPMHVTVNNVTMDLVGYIVVIDYAVVENYTWIGDNLLVNISSNGSTVSVFIPASAVEELAGNVLDALTTLGSEVSIAGYVELYGERVEIVVYTGVGAVVLA